VRSVKIWITVKPQARREEVKKLANGEYSVSVRAPAREGKANEAVVELLAEHFSVPKSSIRIVRGDTARKKLIEVG
jgi:uncharacterized protein (TIGR00251 family)